MRISHWYFLNQSSSQQGAPRQVFAEDCLLDDVNESDVFTADCLVEVQWREVTLDACEQVLESTEAGWGAAYRVAVGRDLGDPDDRHEAAPGYGRRRVQPGGRYAIQVRVQPLRPEDGAAVQFTFRPSEKHLHEQEVDSMVDEIGSADYFLDHAAVGKGIKLTLKEAEALDVRKKGTHGNSRFHQATLLATVWPELEHLHAACLKKLPTRPAKLRALGPLKPGNQDVVSLQRNFAEGRLDSRPGRVGQPLRHQVHTAVAGRNQDTPAAAEHLRTARGMNTLREVNMADLAAISMQMRIILKQRQAQGQKNRRHEKDMKALEAQLHAVEEVLGQLRDLKPLIVPQQLSGLKSRPSRLTSMARHDPDHRAWLAKYDEIAVRCDLTAGVTRRLRLRGSARRRTWELYEYWVAWKFYDYLTRQLKFRTKAGEGWHTLEDSGTDQELVYGLRKGASLTLFHGASADENSWLSVTMAIEPGIPREGREPFRPDLMLTLGGNVRNVPGLARGDEAQVRLIPLVIDAKFRALTEHNAAEVLRSSSEKYQDVLYPRLQRRPMAFLAHPGDIREHSNAERFRAWPAWEPPHGVPPGLQQSHLPYQNGILLLRPPHKGMSVEKNLYGDSDLHRVVSAWLLQNRVTWICLDCGGDLSGAATHRLHELAHEAAKKREENSLPPKPLLGTERTSRIPQPANQHIVCPDCKNVVVISHCSDEKCKDSSGYKTLIAKQFGALEDQKAQLDEATRASWAHEEITVQGNGEGNRAVWDRPCPACGKSMQR